MTSDTPAPLPRDLATGLADFLQALRVEAGVSPHTLAAYRRDVDAFLRGCVEALGANYPTVAGRAGSELFRALARRCSGRRFP